MNQALKSQLAKAYNYLCEKEKCERYIQSSNNLIMLYRAESNYAIRNYRLVMESRNDRNKKKFWDSEWWQILLIPFIIPILEIYLLNCLLCYTSPKYKRFIENRKERREEKKDLKYLKEHKEDFENFKKEAQKNLLNELQELEALTRKRQQLETERNCLLIVPYEPWRTKEAIKYFYDSVSSGYSNTMNEAMNRYQKFIIDMDEIERRNEERRETERRHRESQEALERIARDLEYLRK